MAVKMKTNCDINISRRLWGHTYVFQWIEKSPQGFSATRPCGCYSHGRMEGEEKRNKHVEQHTIQWPIVELDGKQINFEHAKCFRNLKVFVTKPP
jgi:hypothetical protein